MEKKMTKIEAWYRRNFCETIDTYVASGQSDNIIHEIGAVWMKFKTQPIEYIYVGKNKIWIKHLTNQKTK